MEQVSKKEYLGYFSYGFGQCFSYGLVGSFILYFYTDVLKISLAAASIIFLIARVWDAVNDPLIASIMDTRRTKEGKFKGYLRKIPAFVCVSTLLCFLAPGWSMAMRIFYAAATYILWGTIYTISDIPFWSLSAVISKDTQVRTTLITAANLGVFAGMGAVGILLPLLISLFGHRSEACGYFWGVLLLMAVAFLLMMFGHATIKERVEPARAEKITIKEVFLVLKSNTWLFWMLIVFFMNIFMNIVNALALYFFTYNIGNAGLMSVFGLMGTLSAAGFFCIPLLTKKFKKKHLLMGIAALDILVRIFLYIAGYSHIVLVMILLGCTQLFHASCGPLMSAMISETIEYSEVKTGKRCEAITFSGQTFTGKLAAALSGALSGVILSIVGYSAGAAVQTPQTLNGIFFALSVLPILGALVRLLILSRYRYTEEEYRKDLEILSSRK